MMFFKFILVVYNEKFSYKKCSTLLLPICWCHISFICLKFSLGLEFLVLLCLSLIILVLGTFTYRIQKRSNEKNPVVRITRVFISAARNRKTTASAISLELELMVSYLMVVFKISSMFPFYYVYITSGQIKALIYRSCNHLLKVRGESNSHSSPIDLDSSNVSEMAELVWIGFLRIKDRTG